MKGPSLLEVAAAKLRSAQRLAQLRRSYDAECTALDAKALFERLEEKSGVVSSMKVLVEAALLEERLDDAQHLVEEGQAVGGDAIDEVRLLRAGIQVKLASGKPLDALEMAARAEQLLLQSAHDRLEAGEVLLQVAESHLQQGTTAGEQAALNAGLQAVDQFSQAGDSRGEALAWRWVMEAKLRLGKFKDALGAAEAAMVIAVDSGDEVGQALCILSVARAQRARGVPLKAKKAAERALRQFQELGSDLLAAEALELLVQSMIALEQRKEALEKAKHELHLFMGSGDKWAAPRMMGCLSRALLHVDRKKEALTEAEKALEAAEELTKNRSSQMRLEAAKQVALLNMLTGRLEKSKRLADELLSLCREVGDLEGECLMNELLGTLVEQRGALEEKVNQEMEAEELILKLKKAMEERDGPKFKTILEKCYENENVFTEKVEEIISPVIATDPEGLYDFFLNNQPEKWTIDPEAVNEKVNFDTGKSYDRRIMYFAFRHGAMGYGPGFRLIKSAYRLGDDRETRQGAGTLNLMDTCPDWEERTAWHPGILDCVLQVGATRDLPFEYMESTKIGAAPVT